MVVAAARRMVRQTVTVRGFAELAPNLVPKSFSLPARAVALHDSLGTFKSMGLGGIVTDPNFHFRVDGTNCNGTCRLKRLAHRSGQIVA
jgi:hypothetical protein